MPAVLASDAFDRARAFLNDTDIDLYTNTKLLPFLKIANDEFADELLNNNIPVLKSVATDISVTAGTVNTRPTLPDDFIEPSQLFEKTTGDDDIFYTELYQAEFEPNTTAKSTFSFFAWRDQHIILPPVDNTRKIRIRYLRMVTAIASAASSLEITNSLNYLSCKTASLAADNIGQNSMKSDRLEARCSVYLNRCLNIKVKSVQGVQTRRKPFRLNNRRSYI